MWDASHGWKMLETHVDPILPDLTISQVSETRLLDLTLPDPAANLALDEALLEQAEASDRPTQLLRLWESPVPMVVIGRASKVREEVMVEACNAAGVPIYRRCSGGTAIVAGPGCLMYAVVLSYADYPHLRPIDHAHAFVMRRMQAGLSTIEPQVRYQGTSDLTVGDRKFSGNSLRCKRRHLLYHGTVLYDFPLNCLTDWLGDPPRQPHYRAKRRHAAFVTNLAKRPEDIRRAITAAWNAQEPLASWPARETQALVESRYSRQAWNFRH